MRFSCSQSELSKALNIVSKAVTNRTTIPILKGIKINVEEDGILTMSAADLDISIEKKLEVKDFEKGCAVVPAKLFGDIIRKLSSGDIYVSEEDTKINIKSGGFESSIIGFPADEFPNFNDGKTEEKEIVLNKEDFKNIILKTAFAASNDESRGTLTGVLLEIKENSINAAALDGFRMAVNRINAETGVNKNIVIPARIISEAAKIVQDEDDASNSVTIGIYDKKIKFTVGGTVIILKLLDGEFVKYEGILPEKGTTYVNINRNDLLNSLERASLLANVGKNNLIRIEIKENQIEIKSSSEEGNVKESIYALKEGKDLTIGFNSKYMIDALKNIDDEEIRILFNSSINPCLIQPVNGKAYDYLILPVRINI